MTVTLGDTVSTHHHTKSSISKSSIRSSNFGGGGYPEVDIAKVSKSSMRSSNSCGVGGGEGRSDFTQSTHSRFGSRILSRLGPASEAERCRHNKVESCKQSEPLVFPEACEFLMPKYAFSYILETLFSLIFDRWFNTKTDKNSTLHCTSISFLIF